MDEHTNHSIYEDTILYPKLREDFNFTHNFIWMGIIIIFNQFIGDFIESLSDVEDRQVLQNDRLFKKSLF